MVGNTSSSVGAGRLVLGAVDDPAELAAEEVVEGIFRGDTVRVVPAAGSRVGGLPVPRGVQQRIDLARQSGHRIPDVDREVLERAFGADLGHVRLHTGAEAAALCGALSAQAFTVDGHVFVDDGYRPGTDAGRRLLAHELTHVFQAESGVVRRYLRKVVGAGRATVADVLALLKDVKTYESESFAYARGRHGLEAKDVADWIAKDGSFYDVLVASGMSSQDIDDFVASFVNAEDRYEYSDMYWHLLDGLIPQVPLDFTPDWEPFPGVRLAITDLSVNINQTFTPVDNDTVLDFHPTGDVQIACTLDVHLDKNMINCCYVGLTQTVLASWKEVQLSTGTKVTISLDGPHYDGGGQEKPWYDNGESRWFLDDQRLTVTVVLTDRPGMDIPKKPGQTLHSLTGYDHFKTYLAVRHLEGNIALVYYWEWQITYDTDQCAVEFLGEGWYPDGGDAVLGGPRAGEARRIDVENATSDVPL